MRFVLLLTTLMTAFVYSVTANMNIAGLPTTGRCTAENFGKSDGTATVLPDQSIQTAISNFTATKGTGQATVSFDGVRSLFDEDNIGQLSGTKDKRAFLLLYRCAENATGAEWSLITPTTGDLTAIKYDVVANAQDAGYVARSFTDNFSDIANTTDRFWYVGFTMVFTGDSQFIQTLSDDSATLTQIIGAFDAADINTAPFWSPPSVATISYLPEQPHVIYNSSNSDNFTIDGNGFVAPVSSPVLSSTTLGESVNFTFRTTSEFATLPSTNPSYEFSVDLAYGSESLGEAFLTTSANGDELTVSGTVPTGSTTPGFYTLTVTSVIDGQMTASASYALTIKPRPVGVSPDTGIARNVEIGFNENFTITRVKGFSEPSVSGDVSVSFAVTNISTSDLVITEVSTDSNSATFNATLPNVEGLVGIHTFDVTVTETCNNASACNGLVGSYTTTLQIQALGHDFDFASANRTAELAFDPNDENTYIPLYFNSNQGNITDSTTYDFSAVNMKTETGSPLTTADFKITSFVYSGAPQTVNAGAVSAGGVTLTTPAAGTGDTATLTIDGALTANDTFIISLSAFNTISQTLAPIETSITLGFIALEAEAPTVTASAVLDTLTDAAYTWPGGFSSSAFPGRTDTKLSVTFSENVTSPVFQFGASGSATAFDNAGVAATNFTKVVTSGVLQSLLGSNATAHVDVSFSGALDQINNVKRNTMLDPGTFVVTLAQTPGVSAHTTSTLQRNESFSITLTEKVTGVNAAAFSGGNLNGFSVSVNEDESSLRVSPLPGRDLGTNTSASLTIQPGAFFNTGGYPNVNPEVLNLSFAADDEGPILQSSAFNATNDKLTDVEYTLVFNENLSGNATVLVSDVTGDGVNDASFAVTPTNNTLLLTRTGLVENNEYRFTVTDISDAAGNKTTVVLDSFITLGADDQAEIDAVNAAKTGDTIDPKVLGVSPDFRLAANQVNQPLRPVIMITFSEEMAASTTNSVILTDIAGGATGLNLTLEFFDGTNLVLYPSEDLLTATDYWIYFDKTKAVDSAAGNELVTPSYSFKTFDPSSTQENPAPSYLGNNLSANVEGDIQPRFYFNEPVDGSSLSNAIYIKDGSDNAVDGAWSTEANDALFNSSAFIAGQSYTYMVYTSRVADLLGKTGPGVVKNGTFTIAGDTSIRNFNVRVADSGSGTLNVTASWLPPLDKTNVTGYTLSYQTLDSSFSAGSSSPLTTIAAAGAKFTTNALIAGFTEGDSYRFTLTANGPASEQSESVDVTAIPAQSNNIDSQLVSVLSHTASEIGDNSAKAKVIIKPGDLKGSANISVGFIDNANLKAQNGGGTRYSQIVQLEPHGISFNRPVDFALKVEVDLSTIATSCGLALDASCEADLLSLLNPLTFDAAAQSWTGEGLAKSRVELIGVNEALLHARTPHFSSFIVAEAFTFDSAAPANATSISTATIGQTTYVVDIPLTGTPNDQIVQLAFSPNTFGFTSAFVGDNIRISNTEVLRPADELATEVSVTITLTDVASNTTEVRVIKIPILDLNGDPDFEGNPAPADSFSVYLSTDDTANLSWGISSDTTNRTIDKVFISYTNISESNAASTELTFTRGVLSTVVTGLVAGDNYRWNIYTKSAQGNRNLVTGDIERFTYGLAQEQVANGAKLLNEAGVTGLTLTVSGIDAGESLAVSQYSAADILNSVDGILTSSTTLRAPYGTVEFVDGTLMDLNFDNAVGSVQFEVATSESLAVYHYVINSNGTGAWEELPANPGAGVSLSGAIATEENCAGVDTANRSCVTITSYQVGSPFAVGPKLAAPVIIRTGGGGCSVVEGTETNTANGLINLLLMLVPLGLIIFRKLK